MIELKNEEFNILGDEFANISNKINNNNILSEIDAFCGNLENLLPDVAVIQTECEKIAQYNSSIQELTNDTIDVYNEAKRVVESAKMIS